jgi:hypothetical protein
LSTSAFPYCGDEPKDGGASKSAPKAISLKTQTKKRNKGKDKETEKVENIYPSLPFFL